MPKLRCASPSLLLSENHHAKPSYLLFGQKLEEPSCHREQQHPRISGVQVRSRQKARVQREEEVSLLARSRS